MVVIAQERASVERGEWTLWPSQFSSQTDTEHCKVVVVFKVTDTWKKWNLKCILQNSKQSCNVILRVVQYLANIQSPVSNVAVDDHTERGFLWPICLQCCNNCDVKFLDQFLQSSQQNGRWKSGGCFLFSISHYTKQPAEWKIEIWWLLSIFHFPYLRHIIHLMVKPAKPVAWAHALAMRSWHIVNLLHNLCAVWNI